MAPLQPLQQPLGPGRVARKDQEADDQEQDALQERQEQPDDAQGEDEWLRMAGST